MSRQILNKTIDIDGVEIFYREAGDSANPAVLLLHGFPTSSVMFKNLMTLLSDRFHLIAPDYPGFGFSAFPDRDSFTYTFENIACHLSRLTEELGLTSFSIYLHDYGCPIGLWICLKHPERINSIIVQNGNAYEEGIEGIWDEIREYWEHPTEEKKKKLYAFLSEEGTKDQYTAGIPEGLKTAVSPELWMLDWDRMKRPGNLDMQYELNLDYRNIFKLYPAYQEYFRKYQPPALIIWGKYDVYFNVEESPCYKRDLPDAQVHIIEGGHMVLETNFDEVSALIENFLIEL